MIAAVRSHAATGAVAVACILSHASASDAQHPATAIASIYQGGQFSSDSTSAAVSADGRWIVFVVQYLHRDVFLHDRATGETTYVTVGADGDSDEASISSDGRFVAFTTEASNLVPDDTNFSKDVLVYDRDNASFVRASVANDGSQADAGAHSPAISGDGSRVAFVSDSDNLTSPGFNWVNDVFVRDLASGTTMLASSDADGNLGWAASYDPSISANGESVAFTSRSAFDPDDVRECENDGWPESCPDVYVKDLTSGQVDLVSSGTSNGDGESRTPVLSGDGRFVAFASTSTDLVTEDTNVVEDVFLTDRATGETLRLSVATDGQQGDGPSRQPSLSTDGRFVAFTSQATNFDHPDSNQADDVFVHDRVTGVTQRASVDSTGWPSEAASHDPAVADGGVAAFSSASLNLAPPDRNYGILDVFVHAADLRQPTRTVYYGPDRGVAGYDIAVSAWIGDASSGAGVADEFVNFELLRDGDVVASSRGSSDAFGNAIATLTLAGGTGEFRMAAFVSGSPVRQPSSSIVAFDVTRTPTTVEQTVAERAAPGAELPVTALLSTEGGVGIASATVRFELTDAEGLRAEISAITNGAGLAESFLRLDVPAGDYSLRAVFDGSDYYAPSEDPAVLTVARDPVRLDYVGPTGGARGDVVPTAATVTNDRTGLGVAGAEVSFRLHQEDAVFAETRAVTDASGKVEAPLDLRVDPGQYTVEASFAGDAALEPAITSAPFLLGLHATGIAYIGPAEIVAGTPLTLEARLARLGDDTPLEGQPLRFELLADGNIAPGPSVLTDQNGVARSDLPDTVPVGQYLVRASFDGGYSDDASIAESPLTVRTITTSVDYRGDREAHIGEPIRFTAALVDEYGGPLPDRVVEFRIASATETLQADFATTDADGIASVEVMLSTPAGEHVVEALFAGDPTHASALVRTPFASRAFVTVLTYRGVKSAVYEGSAFVEAELVRADDGQPLQGRAVHFTLKKDGVEHVDVAATTDGAGLAGAMLPTTVLPGEYRIEAAFAGFQEFAPAIIDSAFVVARGSSETEYRGATASTHGEALDLQATLRRHGGGAGLAGRTVAFELGRGGAILQRATATTDESGHAASSLQLEVEAGRYDLVTVFEGDAYFSAAGSGTLLDVAARPSVLVASAPASVRRGAVVTFSATLIDGISGSAVAGKTVRLSLGSFAGDAVTGSDGRTSIEVVPDEEPGLHTLHAVFAGDGTHAPDEATATIEIRWEHTFVDSAGAGTIHLNPSTKEFRVVTPQATSSIKYDPSMTWAGLNRRTVVVDAFADGELAMTGAFETDTGRFQASVVMNGRSFTLRRL